MKKKLIKICLVGLTNAGKSTLINNIIGEKISITNKKVNTTEDLIIGIKNIKNNQLIFYDTPGLNNLRKINKINRNLKHNLWKGLVEADLILYLIDIKKYYLNNIKENIIKLNELKKEIIIVFNKNDLIDKKLVLPKIKELNDHTKIEIFFSISAKKLLGLEKLTSYLLSKTKISQWVYDEDEISNKDEIFISNESTRNIILTLLHKEVPYNIKVKNKLFKYLKNGDIKIKQEIEISNLRYKKIILGKNGNKIKDIRTKSQKDISKILKSKIHLYINIVKINAQKI